jgi:hypothetical protein
MRAQTPTSYHPLGTRVSPFPTRGVPGGWHDAWDDDPLEPLLMALPHRGPQQPTRIEVERPEVAHSPLPEAKGPSLSSE